ncbi:sialidase family protein [Lederbergia wuyishanensis]|uniref:Sialidase domain-containing protein n=1 Tax=Lederbergia wuyishanensis TaxID=1347903 RepID=A0ABU0D7M8_9BACI|nr:sialidase family protein [Lederbergia wuyishanensis]MCJ8009096.1 glycoside hydrolase [Lederbergia wuyishanensis]MDQ0344433.1 hypothetical protein [Lederbergia wuyishanensis]
MKKEIGLTTESNNKNKINEKKQRSIRNNLTIHRLDPTKQVIVDREPGQYLGQPDSILLDDDQTILTVYPKGHGIGEALINKSTDGGLTWSGRKSANHTWKDSQETPTIYKLNFNNGSQKLISISGGPGWGPDKFTGWKTSISIDKGETWSDYKDWHKGNQTIVAMSSLVRLKDKEGRWLDKWMGVYHDPNFINYKTYLTFTEDGQEQWSNPKPLLEEYRDIEETVQLCEVCIFRSPDERQLILLARSQSHMHTSTISFSDDEGESWTKPKEVPGSLNGERHKAAYDPISGRLVISFREIILDYNNNGLIEHDDWMAGDWVAWVGTYENLINGEEGEYRILLGEDFTPSRKSGDCGYAGNVVMKDGTFFLNSYGYFDENEVEKLGTEAKPYIMGVRFKLSDFD